MMFYKASTNEFMSLMLEEGEEPPEGVVAVSQERYLEVIGTQFFAGPDGLPVADIETVRSKCIDAIIAERDRRQEHGGTYVGGKWFHSDAKSRIQQLALDRLAAAGQIPQGLMWKTMDGSFTEMTNSLAQQVFMGSVLSDMALFAYAESLKAAVNASPTPKLVDITSGWPTSFTDL